MLIRLTVPADVPESRAVRLLELCAVELWGAGGSPYLERYEIPASSAAAPYSPKSPQTSRRSAMIHAPRAGSESREILTILWVKNGDATAAELTRLMRSGEFTNITHNQVAARLWSLRAAGWIEYVHRDSMHAAGEFVADEDGFVVRATSALGRHFGRVHKLSARGVRLFTSQEARP